jgi:hypothetical protein
MDKHFLELLLKDDMGYVDDKGRVWIYESEGVGIIKPPPTADQAKFWFKRQNDRDQEKRNKVFFH